MFCAIKFKCHLKRQIRYNFMARSESNRLESRVSPHSPRASHKDLLNAFHLKLRVKPYWPKVRQYSSTKKVKSQEQSALFLCNYCKRLILVQLRDKVFLDVSGKRVYALYYKWNMASGWYKPPHFLIPTIVRLIRRCRVRVLNLWQLDTLREQLPKSYLSVAKHLKTR